MVKRQIKKEIIYLTFDEGNGIADLIRGDWKVDMREINDRLLEKHQFPDANKHFDFLCEAIEIIQGFSRIELRDNIVVVPSDLTKFKEVKAKFQKVCDKIDELSELVFELRCDATADMLLQHFDRDGFLDNFKKSLPDGMRVFAQIDEYTGATGNRPTGDWAENFCLHCQKFWGAEKGGGTRPYVRERTTHQDHLLVGRRLRRTESLPWDKHTHIQGKDGRPQCGSLSASRETNYRRYLRQRMISHPPVVQKHRRKLCPIPNQNI